MSQFFLENRHLFQDEHDPFDAVKGERLYQLFPQLKNNLKYQKKLYPQREEIDFAAGKPSNLSTNKVGGNAYNLIFAQQNEEDNQSYQRNSRLKGRSPQSSFLPKIENSKSYQTPMKGRYEEAYNPIYSPQRGYGHRTNQSHNFEDNSNHRGIKTFDLEPRGRFAQVSIENYRTPQANPPEEKYSYSRAGTMKKNVSFEPINRDFSRSEKPMTRQNQHEPLDIIKHRQYEAPAPYRHGLEKQAENRLIYWPKNERPEENDRSMRRYFSTPAMQESRKEKRMSENRGPHWVKEPVFKITGKEIEDENLKVSTFPSDDYQSLKRKLGLSVDAKGEVYNPLANGKKHFSFNREARLEQLESLRDRRNVSDALERRLLVAIDPDRKSRLKTMLRNE